MLAYPRVWQGSCQCGTRLLPLGCTPGKALTSAYQMGSAAQGAGFGGSGMVRGGSGATGWSFLERGMMLAGFTLLERTGV